MQKQLKEIMADILEIDEDQITGKFSPDEAQSWDSMNNLRIITAIEEEFNIGLSMDQIEQMTTFDKILEIIAASSQK